MHNQFNVHDIVKFKETSNIGEYNERALDRSQEYSIDKSYEIVNIEPGADEQVYILKDLVTNDVIHNTVTGWELIKLS